MNGMLQDLRYAVRQLRKSPGFAVVAVLTLAVRIAANTTIFSVIDAVLLKGLPFPQADRLVTLWGVNPSRGWADNPISPRWFVEWQRQNHVFSDMASFQPMISFNLSGTRMPEEVAGEATTPNLFTLLGVRPEVGRGFMVEEGKPDSRVAVLSHGLWQRKFGSDRHAIGKQILLNGEPYTIVGVLPANFSHSYTSPFLPSPQVWVAGFDPNAITWDDKSYGAIARLKPGINLEQAQSEMATIARRIEQQYPEDKGWGVALYKAQEKSVEYTRPALLVLWVAISLVLLIACANLASLLLARSEGRSRELAVRVALGASQTRLLCQLLTESLLLSGLGAGAGLLLAVWTTKTVVATTPSFLLQAMPGLQDAEVNGQVLPYCLLAAMTTGLLFGLAPALGRSRASINKSLKEHGAGSTQSPQSHRLRGFLVVSEFALALVLLVGAGLMIRTLAVLSKLNLGFDRSHVLTMKLPLLDVKFQNTSRRIEFLRQLLPRLNALPGVQSATLTRGLPIEGWSGWNTSRRLPEGRNSVSAGDYLDWKRQTFVFQDLNAWSGESFNLSPTEQPEEVNAQITTPGFYKMMGVRFLLGRNFRPEEGELGKHHEVILMHKLWERLGADRNIIGHQIRLNGELYTVVGVIAPGPTDPLQSQLLVALVFKPEQIDHEFHWLLVMGRLKTGVSIAAAQSEMNVVARRIAHDYPQSNKNYGVSVEPLKLDFLAPATKTTLWLLMGAVWCGPCA